MPIVDELRKLIKTKGGVDIGIMTVADAIAILIEFNGFSRRKALMDSDDNCILDSVGNPIQSINFNF